MAPPQRGFTIIELVIVMIVIGVLALVALPSFQESIRKSRRSEAFTALAAVQQAEERWRSNNAQYTTSLSSLGLPGTTASGRYAISVAAAGSAPLATAYVATAEGVGGTSQAADKQCRRLSVQLNGGNLSYAGCGTCTSFTYTPTHACWAQ
jgi:type IV pilus assembly protein PilE